VRRPTFTGDWQIKKRYDLPGISLRVKVVPPDEAAKSVFAEHADGAFVYNVAKDTAVVLIDGRLPLAVQRYVLLHEVLHAANEAMDIGLEEYPDHVMPKSVARLRGLIPSEEAK
jgi:hypothetical protein